MSFTNFKIENDGDGIPVVTWDSPGRTMNVIDAKVMDELSAIIEQTTADAAVKGVVITSGKDAFCAGADLTMLEGLSRGFAELAASQGEEAAMTRFFEESRRWSVLCRRIETCGKPWVAALNGTALGGGFELALACHRRIAADNPRTRLGQPEVKVGLIPGAGGTQRVARMMQPSDALQFLLKGDQVQLPRAKAMKLIDTVVPKADLIRTAMDSNCRAARSIPKPASWCSRRPTPSTAARPTIITRRRGPSFRSSTKVCSCRWTRRCALSRAGLRKSSARRRPRR